MKNLAGSIVLFFITAHPAFSQTTVSNWPNGKPKEVGTFIDSCFIGKYTYYNENGTVGEQGEFIKAAENNIFFQLNDGAVLDTNAIKRSIIKKQSVQSGKWIYYTDEGIKREEITYLPIAIIKVNGIYDDITERDIFRYSEVPESLKTGTWKIYNEKGNLESEQACTNGFARGLRKEYYDNGVTLKASGNYDNEQYLKTGVWQEFNEQGKIIRTLNYDSKGQLIK